MPEICAAIAVIAAALALRWARKDYRDWRALGPGGLPHTVGGWLLMCVYRGLRRDGRNPRRLRRHASAAGNRAYLGELPRRNRPRPRIAPQPVPQRQLSDCIEPAQLPRLKAIFDAALERNRTAIAYRRSHFERHNEALTMLHPRCGHVHALMSHGEIAHIHPSDGSMHMVLSPRDAQQAIGKDWGELHGLAGFAGRVPPAYTFIYAPSCDADFAVVSQLLDAAIDHMVCRAAAPD